jgi:hypothetical protein
MQSSSTKVVASTVAFTGGDAREVACWGSGGSREHTRMCGVAFFCLTLFVIQGTLLPGGTQAAVLGPACVVSTQADFDQHSTACAARCSLMPARPVRLA